MFMKVRKEFPVLKTLMPDSDIIKLLVPGSLLCVIDLENNEPLWFKFVVASDSKHYVCNCKNEIRKNERHIISINYICDIIIEQCTLLGLIDFFPDMATDLEFIMSPNRYELFPGNNDEIKQYLPYHFTIIAKYLNKYHDIYVPHPDSLPENT